jgi:hypothetical protein
MKLFKAQFRSRAKNISTRWHLTPQAAQEALMKHTGSFYYLGFVAGDVFENGTCEQAPRNGGEVRLKSKPRI